MRIDEDTRVDIDPCSPKLEKETTIWKSRGSDAERDSEWYAETIRGRRFPFGYVVTCRAEVDRIDRRQRRQERTSDIGVPGLGQRRRRSCVVVAQAVRRKQLR